jgi:glycosyltransferase involved in cell wall biosynthesis
VRILFLGYWSLHEPLTVATIFPHLRILQARPDVESICLVTIERGAEAKADLTLKLPFPNEKITFRPLVSEPSRFVLLNKTEDFVRFPKVLAALAAEHRSDFILARGAPAGALAYLVWQRTKLPFYVESFEPHAEYMREAGVWRSYDPRYLFQNHWENQQKKLAKGLMPVADNHKRLLVGEGVPAERIVTVPCSVDLNAFEFSAVQRHETRRELGIPATAPVGIYVGKFGGIYYDEEAFRVFAEAARQFGPEFRLIILTAHPAAEVTPKLQAAGLSLDHCIVKKVPHTQVPAHLSAADFAFVLSRPAPCLSPIKVGEYWASGLPILLTENVGDDSDIIKKEGGGAVFNVTEPGSVAAGLQRIAAIMAQPGYRQQAVALARKYRSPERARDAYNHFFGPAPAAAV